MKHGNKVKSRTVVRQEECKMAFSRKNQQLKGICNQFLVLECVLLLKVTEVGPNSTHIRAHR